MLRSKPQLIIELINTNQEPKPSADPSASKIPTDPFSVLAADPYTDACAHLKTRTLGRSVSDPLSEACQREVAFEAKDAKDIKDAMLYKFIRRMHGCLQKSKLLEYIENLKSYISTQTTVGAKGASIPVGCACSGSAIWAHANEALAIFWAEGFGLDRVVK